MNNSSKVSPTAGFDEERQYPSRPKQPISSRDVLESSGLSVALLLKCRLEFRGMTFALVMVALFIFMFCSLVFMFEGAQIATLKHLAMKQLTENEVAQTSISQSTSAYEGITYVAKQLSSIIAKSNSMADRIGINDVSLGTAVGNIRAVIFEMNYWTDGTGFDGRKSLDHCSDFPDLCHNYYNALNSSNFTQSNANLTLWTHDGYRQWNNFSRIFSDANNMNLGLYSQVLLFDMRNNSCTLAFAANAVATLLNSLLPASAPFMNAYGLWFLIENQWSDPRYGTATTKGAYILMDITTQNNDLYYVDDQAYPYPFQWDVITLEFTSDVQFYDSIRVAVDLCIVLIFLGLIVQWCRELSLHRWQRQSIDGIMLWWKWMDILFLVGCQVFYILKLYNLGIVNGNLSMSRKPIRNSSELFYGKDLSLYGGAFNSNSTIAAYILCTILYPTLKLFGCFRYHSELRVYKRFMHYFMHHVEGFLWVFLIIIVFAATIEFGLSMMSGNSSIVHNFSSAFNTMMLLTFAQMDLDSIVNGSRGYPWGFQWLAFFFYWIFTISLTLLAQNLVLAIIGNAHDCSRRRLDAHREGTSVLGYMFKLLRFQLIYVIVWQTYVFYSLFSVLRGCGGIVLPSFRVLTATWMCHYLEPQVFKHGIFRLELMWATMLKHYDTITQLNDMYLCVTTEIPSLLLYGKINLPNGMTVRINLQALQQLPYIDDIVKAQLTKAIAVTGINEGILHVIDSKRVSVEFSISHTDSIDINANDDDNEDVSPIPYKFEFYVESDYSLYLRTVATTSQSNIGLQSGSTEHYTANAKCVNDHNDGTYAGGIGDGVFIGHVSEHIFDVLCLKRSEKEFLTILEYVSEEKSLTRPNGILEVLSSIWKRKSSLPVPNVNKETGETAKVAYDLFVAFQGSPLQRDRNVETKLQQQTEKNVFDMVDESLDADFVYNQDQDLDSTFVGGYRNSVVINKLQQMNKKLSQSTDENKKMLYEMEQRIVKLLMAKE